MVQVYVWLVVAVLLAAGVLLLAGAATQGSGSDRQDGPRGPLDAARQGWRDFRSGLGTLRARATGRRSAPASQPPASGAQAPVDGAPARVSVLVGAPSGPSGRPSTDAWSFETPRDTTIEDFFAATQTSEPAYLDTAQVSDVLHRRR